MPIKERHKYLFDDHISLLVETWQKCITQRHFFIILNTQKKTLKVNISVGTLEGTESYLEVFQDIHFLDERFIFFALHESSFQNYFAKYLSILLAGEQMQIDFVVVQKQKLPRPRAIQE